jgi:two-component system, cell cycle sensor histidine kinase and response regulator CckA
MQEPTRIAQEDALCVRIAEAASAAWALSCMHDDVGRGMETLLSAAMPVFDASRAEILQAHGSDRRARARAEAPLVAVAGPSFRVEQILTHDGTTIGWLAASLPTRSVPPECAQAWQLLTTEATRMLHADKTAQARRSTLEAMRSRESMCRNLVELSNDLVQSVDPTGRILFVNAAWRRTLGVEGLQLEGRSIMEYVHPDCFEHCMQTMKQTFQGQPLQRVSFALRNALGTKVWVEGDVIPRIENGVVVSTQGFFRRVHAPGETTAESLRRLELHDEAWEGSPEALAFLSVDGKVTRVNSEFSRLFGYTAEDAIGSSIDQLVVPERFRVEGADLCQRAGRSETINIDTIRRRKDGSEIDVSLIATPVRVHGRQVAIQCIYRDIRDRKRLEAQLARSQRMEAVGRLAGGISHDFNNMLTVIHSTADMVFDRLPKTDALREDIREIARAADRAASLTRQLLAFSRKQVLTPLVMNLNECASEVVRMLKRLIGEDIEIVSDLYGGIGMVLADPGQMEQVLMNLSINARDAMPNGGTLRIATANATVDEDGARTIGIASGDYVTLTVQDTGSGIAPELLDRIFEPFFSTKAETGNGTGLGLATVYGIVQQSQGAITVKSEVGKGSTFTVYLPRNHDAVTTRDAEPTDRPRAQSETILVVEDDRAIRALVERALAKAGYNVLVADSPSEALELVDKNPQITLLFTDVVMPGMNGPELAQRVLATRPKMRVLFTSGYADDKVFQDSGTPAGAHFLPKPYSFSGLASKIRETLQAP